MKNSWCFLCITTRIKHHKEKAGGWWERGRTRRRQRKQRAQIKNNLEQRGLYEIVGIKLSTRLLLSGFLKKIFRGREYLGASFSDATPQKTHQFVP